MVLLMVSEANHMHEKGSSLMHDFRPRLYSVSRGSFCEEDFHAPLFAETISEANRVSFSYERSRQVRCLL
jgi:hypothetical protein